MTNEDFLELVDNDTCRMFTTPITDNEPIWALLNTINDIFIYGLSKGYKNIQPIRLEILSEMLSKRETHNYYDVVYLCEEEINLKNEVQPDFQKSEQIIIDEKFCDNEHRLGNCNGDHNCSLCQDTIIIPEHKPPTIDKEKETISISKKAMGIKTVWDLEMHDHLHIETPYKNYLATRVPGGWLYKPSGRGMSTVPSTFVPWVDQIHDKGCVLCGHEVSKTAELIVEVLDYLDGQAEAIDMDTKGVLLNHVKEYLKRR